MQYSLIERPNGQALYCQHQTAQTLKGSQQVNIARKCLKLGKQIADDYKNLH